MSVKKSNMTKRVTEYFVDPLDGEQVVETWDDPKEDESQLIVNAIEPATLNDISSQEVEACGCKDKAKESRKAFDKFIEQKIKVLTKGHEGRGVSMLMGAPRIIGNAADGHKKIKGTLAYAGVSLNNRLYLPEELAKGDGMTVPLIINHASTAGAEQEIGMNRVPEEVVKALQNGEQYEVGQVTLQWDAEMNTLFYEGHIQDEFWQQEVIDADMAVSLGMYYDSDSPQICNTQCYTVIRGAEFHEVSLVYHPGFPIATIEAVEVRLKMMASEAIKNSTELSFESFLDFEALENIVFADAKEGNRDDIPQSLRCGKCGGTGRNTNGTNSKCPRCEGHGLNPDLQTPDTVKQFSHIGESTIVNESVEDDLDIGRGVYGVDPAMDKKREIDPRNVQEDEDDEEEDWSDESISTERQKERFEGNCGDCGGLKRDYRYRCSHCGAMGTDAAESKKKLLRVESEVDVMDQTVVDQKAQEVMTQLENLNQKINTHIKMEKQLG